MDKRRFNPFPKLNTSYGAPMGRVDTHAQPFPQGEALCVSRPQCEYDSGGAYWGFSNGEGPVWAVWIRGKGREGVKYVRAFSSEEAKRKAASHE
jgi:hypothetical protein